MRLYYVTFPDEAEKDRIADTVVDEHLAACVVSTDVSSLYRLDGEKTQNDEVVALFKTGDEHGDALVDRIEELHPYDVPCILEIPVDANAAYAEWVDDITTGGE